MSPAAACLLLPACCCFELGNCAARRPPEQVYFCASDPYCCSATSLITARYPTWRGATWPRALGCRSLSHLPRAALTWRRRFTSWCVVCFCSAGPVGQFFFHHAADAVSCRSEKSGVKPLRSHLALLLLLPKKKRKKAVATSSRLANILIQVSIAFTH